MTLAGSDIQWGDVPTWSASGVAMLTLIAAVTAAVQTAKVYRLESARDNVAEQDRRDREEQDARAQASRVSAWVLASPARRVPAVLVRNASELPVYRCLVRSRTRDAVEIVDELEIVPPTTEPLEIPLVRAEGASQGALATAVSIEFTDAGGVRWHRDFDGGLESVDEPDSSTPSEST